MGRNRFTYSTTTRNENKNVNLVNQKMEPTYIWPFEQIITQQTVGT